MDSPWLAVSGNTFHCVWEEGDLAGPGKEGVYTRSTNGGISWSPPVIVTGATGNIQANNISVVADGNLVLVAYVEDVSKRVFAVRSIDAGATFGAPVLVESTVSGTSDDPVVEIRGNTVLVAWNEDDPVSGIEGVHCAVSQNGGASYAPEVNIALQVLGVAGADCDNADVAIESSADLYLVYSEDSQDIAGGGIGGNAGNKTYVAHSHDGGATWIRDQPIDVGVNTKLPVITASQGNLMVATESAGMLRMHTSTDRAATWISAGTVPSGGTEVDLEDVVSAKFVAASPITGTTLVPSSIR